MNNQLELVNELCSLSKFSLWRSKFLLKTAETGVSGENTGVVCDLLTCGLRTVDWYCKNGCITYIQIKTEVLARHIEILRKLNSPEYIYFGASIYHRTFMYCVEYLRTHRFMILHPLPASMSHAFRHKFLKMNIYIYIFWSTNLKMYRYTYSYIIICTVKSQIDIQTEKQI